MDFGAALREIKVGRCVRRRGWNGKGMWIALTPGSKIDPSLARAGAAMWAAAAVLENEGVITIDPHIDMWTAGRTLQVGWLASQADMLAEDWEIVE